MNEAIALAPEVKPAKVDCGILRTLIHQLEESDQKQRQGSGTFDPRQDLKNLSIAMGIIENCGMPSSSTHLGLNLNGLWLVFQHAPHKYRKAYFHHFQEAAEKGGLAPFAFAVKDAVEFVEVTMQD